MVPLTQDWTARKQPSQKSSHAMSLRTIIGKNAPEFGLPEKTFTLPRFSLLKRFSKAVLAERGGCLQISPLSFSLFHHSSFFSLPFFVCLRGVEDKGVFTSQSFYLEICPSLKSHLSSYLKQSNFTIPWIYFQCFFKMSAEYLF